MVRLTGKVSIVALSAALLSGCGGSSSIISTPPNQNATKSTVTVFTSEMLSSEDVIQIPLVGGTVVLSKSIIGTSPQNPIASGVTNQAGQVTFSALPASGQLCVSIESKQTFVSKCRHPFPAAVTLSVGASNN